MIAVSLKLAALFVIVFVGTLAAIVFAGAAFSIWKGR